MILVVVYVGAVAVLFLFVVMMLDIDFAELREGFLRLPADRRADRRRRCWPSWCSSSAAGASSPDAVQALSRAGARRRRSTTPQALGQVLYTDYVYLFQTAGLVLLVAMIGAIVLTLRQPPGRAPPEDQRPARARPTEETMTVVKVPSREGV